MRSIAIKIPDAEDYPENDCCAHAYADGWNRCREELIRLNETLGDSTDTVHLIQPMIGGGFAVVSAPYGTPYVPQSLLIEAQTEVERLNAALATCSPGLVRSEGRMIHREEIEFTKALADKGHRCEMPAETVAKLCRVYLAWVDGPEGEIDSAYWDHLRIVPDRGVPLEMVGKRVRLVLEGEYETKQEQP